MSLTRSLSIFERLLAFVRRNRLSNEERARLADDRARRKSYAMRRALRKGKLERAEKLSEDIEALRKEAEEFRALG